MSKCHIIIDFNGSADELLQSANTAITASGGNFTGTAETGAFSIQSPLGKISGNYVVQGQTFHIHVTDKPFLVSCSRIESELRKNMG